VRPWHPLGTSEPPWAEGRAGPAEVPRAVSPDTEFVPVIRTPSLSLEISVIAYLFSPVSGRILCPAPSLCPFAVSFFSRWQLHADPATVAQQLHLPVRSVRRLFARFDQRGAAGLAPDYHHCGGQQPSRAPADGIDQVCQLRRQHPTWGAELIRVIL